MSVIKGTRARAPGRRVARWRAGCAKAASLRASSLFLILQLTVCEAAGAESSGGPRDELPGEERTAIFEIGGAAERELSERTSHFGPAVGVEIEPIEDWLEIEFGASRFRSQGATVWELDLAFKKPWRLSSMTEVMAGLGPTWTHNAADGERVAVWGVEAVVDFFFWRTRRFGWYVEPSYGIALGDGNKKSAGLTAGVFFGLP